MAVSVPQQPTPAQQLALSMKYGPSSGLAFQRSQYLADALQSLQQNAQSNTRTGTALGANLLAAGILQWGKHKADQNAMTAYTADQKKLGDDTFAGTPADPTAPPPPPSAAPAPPAQIGGPPPVAAQTAAPPPTQAPVGPAAPPSPLLVKMMLGEAGGEGDTGMKAVGHVALNRLAKKYGGAQSLDQVLNAPHQFDGLNTPNSNVAPNSPAYQHAAALAAQLSGEPDMTNGATQFLNPELTQKLYGHIPTWAQGNDGQRIGHHVFFGGQPGQQAPQMAQQGAPPPPGLPGQQAGPAPPVGPYQVAANGPTPPPPQSAMQPPPPVSSAGPGGPAPAPAGPLPGGGAGAVPHNYVNPQEWVYARKLFDDPRTRDQGLALAQQLHMKEMAPPDPSKPYWQGDGQAHYAPGTTFTDQPSPSPNQFVQRGPDNQIHVTGNNAYGAVPAGSAMNGAGGLGQLPVAEKPRFRIPNAPGFYTLDEKGNPQKVADDNYTVKDVGATMQELTSSQQYDKAAKLTEMYRGMIQAATRPGGISDAELKDNAAQIFSGGVARQFNAKMIDEGQGPLLRLKQFGGEIMSGQKLSPQARQAIAQASLDYATEAQGAFSGLAQSKAAFAAQNSVDITPFIKPLMKDLPPIPDINSIPTGAGGYNDGSHPAPNPEAAAIQAEIARRKAAGTWKGK